MLTLGLVACAVPSVSSEGEDRRQLRFDLGLPTLDDVERETGNVGRQVENAGRQVGNAREQVEDATSSIPSNPREALDAAVELSTNGVTGIAQFEAACRAAGDYCEHCGVDVGAKRADVEYQVTKGTKCVTGAADNPFELPCGAVFWGNMIHDGDYNMVATVVAADFMGGGSTFTLAYVKNELYNQVMTIYKGMMKYGNEILKQITDRLLEWLVNNPGEWHTLFDSLGKTKFQLSFAIISYSRAKCLYSPADGRFIQEVPLPTHYEPAFGMTLTAN
ncbi:unnamed protein product [Vitrella brassicaformis CCMP3155]|uniref:Uncharacterized protein n=1 Tax=Vitrella brassicaformis (strain CCMP3155) TaxID=1169540 RepID=A0A0G4EBM0_VITBC|nr:unnamed protein product [Vitrella brassicaformis CCMP3155]|eukprot:CEL92694.1 unnamed protein product [Vitrella brassicaformis CCMP3155]